MEARSALAELWSILSERGIGFSVSWRSIDADAVRGGMRIRFGGVPHGDIVTLLDWCSRQTGPARLFTMSDQFECGLQLDFVWDED